jgi:YbgC/YbaW family acyl-CoA thioester hydrolase
VKPDTIWQPPPRALSLQVLVSMADVDSYQIHYHSYYRWIELAHHQLLRRAGMTVRELLAQGAATPAVHSECDYFVPVQVDETLTLLAWIDRPGKTSYAARCLFMNAAEQVVAQGQVIHVYIEHGRPVPLPAWLLHLASDKEA